jgi:hypothetical protein
MKRIYLALILFSFLISACNTDKESENIDLSSRTKVVLHSFSDTTKQDTFKLILSGKKPKDMALNFTITPEGGTPVYTKVLKATELLDNYKESVDLGRTKKQVKFIEEELELFFAEENFLDPAVTAEEQPDKNTPDKTFFAELKSSGLNGFQYRLGKETKVYIAWSAQQKKVMPYYECCK